MSFSYGQHALASSNPIELVAALYDGAIRFLAQAASAADANDVSLRRRSVKRALDIYLHLESRLRYDIDSQVAATLSRFYAEMFHHTLRASAANSRVDFERVIARLAEVKDAWKAAARDPQALQAIEQGRA